MNPIGISGCPDGQLVYNQPSDQQGFCVRRPRLHASPRRIRGLFFYGLQKEKKCTITLRQSCILNSEF